jgi:hypothetical protein
MRYEGSRRDDRWTVDRVLSIINFLLVIVITFCVNYMFTNLLFR